MPSNPFQLADPVKAIIRIRRGPETDRMTEIYEDGELVWSTDKKRLFVGDNINVGGILAGNKVWFVDSFLKLPNIQINDCVFRTDTSAFYILTGDRYLMEDNYVLVGGRKLVNSMTSTGGGGSFILPDATTTTKGGVFIGDGLNAVNGVISVDYDSTTLKIISNKLTVIGGGGGGGTTTNASYNNHGIVRILKTTDKGGINVDAGYINVNIDGTTIKLNNVDNTIYVPDKIATTSKVGSIKIGTGLSANGEGLTNLKIATDSSLGGIVIGNGLNIDSSTGILDVDGQYFDSVPIGSISWFALSTAPAGYLECDGSVKNKSEYNQLYQAISGTYNIGGESATQFRLPDLRGEFVRGWDHGRGVDSGRTFASSQSGSYIYPHVGVNVDNNLVVGGANMDSIGNNTSPTNGVTGGAGTIAVTSPKLATRPRNVALMACIKAKQTVNGIVVATGDYIPKPPPPVVDGSTLIWSMDESAWEAVLVPSIKAWVNFDGTKNSSGGSDTLNTNRKINASYNVRRVLRHSIGVYTIEFMNPLQDQFYVIGGSGLSDNSASGNDNLFPAPYSSATMTSTSAKIAFQYNTGSGTGNQPTHDASIGMVSFVR